MHHSSQLHIICLYRRRRLCVASAAMMSDMVADSSPPDSDRLPSGYRISVDIAISARDLIHTHTECSGSLPLCMCAT